MKRFPQAEVPLLNWRETVKAQKWNHFSELKMTYGSADMVGRYTVFNIKGNDFRLAAVVVFHRGCIYIKHVMTHEEYDKGDWRN